MIGYFYLKITGVQIISIEVLSLGHAIINEQMNASIEGFHGYSVAFISMVSSLMQYVHSTPTE